MRNLKVPFCPHPTQLPEGEWVDRMALMQAIWAHSKHMTRGGGLARQAATVSPR